MSRKVFAMGALAAGLAGAAVLQVVPEMATVDVPGLKTARVTGSVLSVYNSPATFDGIKRGLKEQGFRVLRFPNGSMSNWYHWNGEGRFDSVGIWHGDSTKVGPGILTNSLYRGTTQQYSGAGFHSRITDGVDSTFWWSDPLGAGQPWILLNLASSTTMDSVRIAWHALRPDSVEVGLLNTGFWNGFGGMDAQFVRLAAAAVGASDSATFLAFADTSAQFLAVRPLGIKPEGVQIGEVTIWGEGKEVTVKSKDPSVQTQVTAMGAHPGSAVSPNWTKAPGWTFAKYIEYIESLPDVEALICVNYGTGTPEEAAAWVKHANIDRKLGIEFWEIGNEMDGYWEEGGPVTAQQYATKYLAFARAMKNVDPSIKLFGPVMSTSEFDAQPSMSLDGRTWTEEVLRIVGEAETKDGIRYLDGFDFHAYPYWTDGKPTVSAAFSAVRNLKPRLDTLAAMMKRQLRDPGSRLVNLSEVNLSVVSSSLIMQPENSVALALSLSQLIEAVGGNAISIVWEGFNGGSVGGAANGGTWGALSLFADPRSGTASSEKFVPTAAYWGNWMISKVWAIDSAKPLPASVAGNSGVLAKGLVRGADTSWLLMNLTSRACTTKVTNFASGWIYTFSKAQYAWNGTSDQAFAFPNAGPSGRPIPAAWNQQVEIPAYGMAVVRNTAAVAVAPAGEGHLVNVTLNRKQIEVSDTIRVSGTFLRAPAAAAPSVAIGDTTILLKAIDGAWDADQEAFVASIPASAIGEGTWKVAIGAADSIELVVTGVVRPNVWIDRFDDAGLVSEQASKAKWFSWQADAEDSSDWSMKVVAREGNSNMLRTDAVLVQPAALGYTVAGFTGLALDSIPVSQSLGIKFDYATWSSNKTATFALGISTDTVKDYQDYSVTLKNTDTVWNTARLLWSQFSQPSWAVQCGPLLARQINQINFRVQGAGKAKIWIDNVALLGTTGDSVTGIHSRVRGGGWTVRRSGTGWRVEASAGTRLSFVAIDGRRQASLEVPSSGVVDWKPQRAGMVYLVAESKGRREVRMLPSLR